ncbi:MAG: PIN domain-containing protein [Alphaproteobacteria bacterium]|nr:PIN domain-containing protein [Alphaproteobacteria bacterium]
MPVRATLDSNILVYAELEAKQPKGIAAQRVIELAAPNGVIVNQALLEFVAVVCRRLPTSLPSAIVKVEAWSQVFETAPTTSAILSEALRIVTSHQLQVWDAVIWAAARSAGATVFFSENLQDGLKLDSMRVVNPFRRTDAELAALLNP